MSRHQPDYYALLGVDRSVSAADLDRAYRRAARATHPDVHPHDSSAAERFHAVTIAYETLSDPRRRASYDRDHRGVQPADPVRFVVYPGAQPRAVPPVELGRRRPAEPLRPFRSGATDAPVADVFELVAAMSRLLRGWPFP